jgi:hypothetical protein
MASYGSRYTWSLHIMVAFDRIGSAASYVQRDATCAGQHAVEQACQGNLGNLPILDGSLTHAT